MRSKCTYKLLWYLRPPFRKQDWSSNDDFVIEARAIGHNRIGLRVTNTPLRKNLNNLVAYSRSLVKAELFENEGFGSLWLKSINGLLHGEFGVQSEWLMENTSEEDYPPKFWLEIIIPSQTDKKE